jgi:hypothetical protein
MCCRKRLPAERLGLELQLKSCSSLRMLSINVTEDAVSGDAVTVQLACQAHLHPDAVPQDSGAWTLLCFMLPRRGTPAQDVSLSYSVGADMACYAEEL